MTAAWKSFTYSVFTSKLCQEECVKYNHTLLKWFTLCSYVKDKSGDIPCFFVFFLNCQQITMSLSHYSVWLCVCVSKASSPQSSTAVREHLL